MTILKAALLVVFIMVALLLILLVLVQNEEGDSLGGIFAGGSSSAFGSRSGNVLTRATSVLGALFLILSFGLALVNRSSNDSGVEAVGVEVKRQTTEANRNWWQEDEAPAPVETAPLEAPRTETVIPETSVAEEPVLEIQEPENSEPASETTE
jgi:preprotein translocase subunit SecG